jgi:predicted transcriptional regulator
MKTITIQGVPYSVEGQVAYIYGTNTAIGTIGTVTTGTTTTTDSISFKDGWDKDPAVLASLKEYRETLNTATKAALAKAAEIQKA